MKTVEKMSDQELGEKLFEYANDVDDFSDPENAEYKRTLRTVGQKLCEHPAQRIADLTGGVVTKEYQHDPTGSGELVVLWLLWVDSTSNLCPWQHGWDGGDECLEIYLPDDNRPWQESIYKPQVNVKNGGKDGNK